jgi:hypothetical protein
MRVAQVRLHVAQISPQPGQQLLAKPAEEKRMSKQGRNKHTLCAHRNVSMTSAILASVLRAFTSSSRVTSR